MVGAALPMNGDEIVVAPDHHPTRYEIGHSANATIICVRLFGRGGEFR
jgi:hypothetical protein